eukprot:TRINITY_DN66569_c0_g1_i1.p1 TRINITY_DN66569_c0_g1~~TRINITY_DN66569_c0_g1_i1.p1  ORF type:complete len:128 (-),score=28.35 TRINITY_DN66569_c0_g1_i1:628-1011(-)
MAASGINEHKEGCRKQRVLDRAANARRMMMDGQTGREGMAPMPQARDDPDAPGYMRKMGSPPGISGSALPGAHYRDGQALGSMDMGVSHDPVSIDRLRREGVRAQQLVAYSAKLPERLSSVNYAQQW